MYYAIFYIYGGQKMYDDRYKFEDILELYDELKDDINTKIIELVKYNRNGKEINLNHISHILEDDYVKKG